MNNGKKCALVTGAEAVRMAREEGHTLLVLNPQRGWIEAGPGAVERAERMERHALWIYGVIA